MNRAMGFGIACSSILAGTFLSPSPASAHSSCLGANNIGWVCVGGVGHRNWSIVDNACDGIVVQGQFTMGDGSKFNRNASCTSGWIDGTTNTWGIAAYRKCTQSTCSDWVGA
jgi:hypothetical protein